MLERFRKAKALRKGHFVLAAGGHAEDYVAKNLVFTDVRITSELCRDVANLFLDQGIEVVASPAVAGVALSQWVTHWLRKHGSTVPVSVFADKADQGGFTFERGYPELMKDKTVLIVEDVLTSGKSVKQVIEAVRRAEGIVVGVGGWWNRGGVTAELLGVPLFHALVDLDLPVWSADKCPLCERGVPVNTDFGHGKKFLDSRRGAPAIPHPVRASS